jgi:hypothetical protein
MSVLATARLILAFVTLAQNSGAVLFFLANGVYVLDKLGNLIFSFSQFMICGNASNVKKMADVVESCWSPSNLEITCGRESEADLLDFDTIDNLLAEVPTAPRVSFVNWVVSFVRRG